MGYGCRSAAPSDSGARPVPVLGFRRRVGSRGVLGFLSSPVPVTSLGAPSWARQVARRCARAENSPPESQASKFECHRISADDVVRRAACDRVERVTPELAVTPMRYTGAPPACGSPCHDLM